MQEINLNINFYSLQGNLWSPDEGFSQEEKVQAADKGGQGARGVVEG